MSQDTSTQDPTEARKKEGDGVAAWLLMLAILAVLGPIYSLFMDGAERVTERQLIAGGSASERHERTVRRFGWAQTLLLYVAFPVVLAVLASITPIPGFAVFGVGLLALLAVAKRTAARRLVPYKAAAVVKDCVSLPKPMLIITGVLLALTVIGCLPFLGAPATVGMGFLFAYPVMIWLGRERTQAWIAYEAKILEAKKNTGIAMGCTPAQLGAMYIRVDGELEAGTYRIRATDIPFEIVSHLPGVEDRLAQFVPYLAVEQADTSGLVLVMATEEVIEQRRALAASGGLVAGSEAVTDSAGVSDLSGSQDWDF